MAGIVLANRNFRRGNVGLRLDPDGLEPFVVRTLFEEPDLI
jgi:hypothetical protein